MIRIVLGDDHTIVREGLKQVLSGVPDFAVVGEARNGEEVMQRVRGADFDVLLLDMSMPGRNGIELIKQVLAEKPRLRVLVLSVYGERQYAVRTIKAGASGYLNKQSASEQLVSAIRKVAGGGAFISNEVAEQLALGTLSRAQDSALGALSDREFQVLRMLAAGKSVSEIARELHLSAKTVSTHKARMMQKTNLGNFAELVRYAMLHGLLEDADSAGS